MPPSNQPDNSVKQKMPRPLFSWFAAALLVLLVAAAYQSAWRAGFIWDDDMYVTQNRLLTDPGGLRRIWLSRDSPSQYFPLTYTVLRVERRLWDLNSSRYHCLNILLHGLNAILLWRLLRRLEVPGHWFGAALFALHPVNVESVAWVTELKNILSLLFYLLALRAWVEFIDASRPHRRRFYALALVAFALALFSKTTACTLPAALVLILWLQKKELTTERLWPVAPFVLMGFIMGLVSIWWERSHQFAVGAAFELSWLDRFLIATHAIWFYAGKILWPVNLTFIYPQWRIDPHQLSAWLWPLLTALAALALFLFRRSLPRAVIVALLFYVAALSPLLGFVMEYTFRYTFVADHYQYIASIAPCALIAALLNRGLLRFADAGCFAFRLTRIALLLLLGILTWRQARLYRDSETLWRANVARNPNAAISHNNLAAALLDNHKIGPAILECRAGLALDPSDANAHNTLGCALLDLGQTADALKQFRLAALLDPNNPMPHYNLGRAALAQNDFTYAAQSFRRAADLKPDFAEACCNLGYALLRSGRVEDAIPEYQRALQINPDYALANNDLGSIYLQERQLENALACFQRAAASAPTFVEAQCNLAQTLALLGRRDEAIARLQQALKIHPGYAPAVTALQRLSTKSPAVSRPSSDSDSEH